VVEAMSGSDDADHIVLTLPRGERGELRLSRSRYQGSTFTKFHLWYPGKDGELHPGRQVVTIRDGELAGVIEALSKIAGKVAARPTHENPRQRRLEPAPPDRSMEDAESDMEPF
jgi:hypothetical protein